MNYYRNVVISYTLFGLFGLGLYYIPTVKSAFLTSLFYIPWILLLLLNKKIRSDLGIILKNKEQILWSLKSGTIEGLVVLCSIQILSYPLGAENLVLASMWPLFMFLTTVSLGLEERTISKILIALFFALGLFLIKKEEFMMLSFSLGTLFVLIRVLVSTYGSIFNKKSTEVHDCTFSQWVALNFIRWVPMMTIGLISGFFYETITIEYFNLTNILFYGINALVGGLIAHSLILNSLKVVSFFQLLTASVVGRLVTISGFLILGRTDLTFIKILGIGIVITALVGEKINENLKSGAE